MGDSAWKGYGGWTICCDLDNHVHFLHDIWHNNTLQNAKNKMLVNYRILAFIFVQKEKFNSKCHYNIINTQMYDVQRIIITYRIFDPDREFPPKSGGATSRA